ncbi:leukocidin family pore-forming toxin [Burkholderia ubonensis]|uniref:leukocidin family pore-forming toxin n=1 Tax=Burkholderia ubonensis TaxID=101571 RepID=UPI0009B43379|nr:leukocidin family pore-forming toxin [Burkholderia ubonensis]
MLNRRKISAFSLIVLGAAFAMLTAEAAEPSIPTGSVATMLNHLPYDDAKLITYVSASDIFDNAGNKKLLAIRADVINNGKIYFLDFGSISDKSALKRAKEMTGRLFGVSFSDKWLVVSAYRESLIYTPMASMNSIAALSQVVRRTRLSNSIRTIAKYGIVRSENAGAAELPYKTFYVEAYRPISSEDCTFRQSINWGRGDVVLCKNANISLIYRVTLMRSLKFGSSGSSTPDAKIVRISLDQNSTGAGINLNDRLYHFENFASYPVLDGWMRDYVSSVIAKDYTFSVSATGSPVYVLKTFPASNLNKDYESRQTSGFEVGISGGIDGDESGPKAKLEGRASYNQSFTFAYKTQDYNMIRHSNGPADISFSWEREEYSTAASMLGWSTDAIWGARYPIDVRKISPISYTGFTPNFDVVYMAPPSAAGETTFSISSSVNMWPIYSAIYKHYYVIGAHLSAQAKDEWQIYKRIVDDRKFTVHWGDVVFSGGRPVNLQLADFNSRCVASDVNGKISVEACNLQNPAQSFIYDELGRYRSAIASDRCLDANDVGRLASCSADLSQRWDWVEKSDNIKNKLNGLLLSYSMINGKLALATSGYPGGVGTRLLTQYTDVFSSEHRTSVVPG